MDHTLNFAASFTSRTGARTDALRDFGLALGALALARLSQGVDRTAS